MIFDLLLVMPIFLTEISLLLTLLIEVFLSLYLPLYPVLLSLGLSGPDVLQDDLEIWPKGVDLLKVSNGLLGIPPKATRKSCYFEILFVKSLSLVFLDLLETFRFSTGF